MSDFKAKPAKLETILNSSKMKLSAMNPSKKWANLHVDLYRSNPRIVVSTNEESLRNENDGWGKITAAVDPWIMNSILTLIETAIRAEGEWKTSVENSNHSYVNGQRAQEITHQNTIWVGKDDKGCVFISVIHVDPKFPKIKFVFGPSDMRYVKFKHSNGADYTKAELSVLSAKSWVEMMRMMVNSLLVQHYEPAPKPNGGGGGFNRGGGNNFNRGNQQRGQQQSGDGGKSGFTEPDDDIPF